MLLVVAVLGVGVSRAWAYVTPDGYGVKTVYVGTPGSADANGVITTVTAEDFESVSTLPSAWGVGTMSSVAVGEVTEVALPDVGEAIDGNPTYVGGKCVKASYRGRNYDLHAVYTLSNVVTKGNFVFSGDLYHDTYTYHYSYISIVDTEGNNLLKIGFSTASGVRPIMCSYMGSDGEQTSTGIDTNSGLTTIRTYRAYGIKDLIISPETGAFSFTVDYIDRNAKRAQKSFSGTMKTGVSIAAVYIGSVYTDTKNTLTNYVCLDNVLLYTVEPVYDYTINYTNGGSTIKTDTGKSFEGITINAAESVTVNDVTYVPAGDATTSMTMTTTPASNVLNVAMVASVPYTISYKYNGTTIKSEEGNAETGTQVNASITTSLWNDVADTKYYVADDATTTFDVTASDNDFVVNLRLANTSAIATIAAVCGGTTLATFTDTGLEGETSNNIFYPRAVLYNGSYYTIDTDNYAATTTYGSTLEKTYTQNENIKFFAECENMSLSRKYGEVANNVNYSSGGGKGIYGGAYIESTSTIPAGTYTLSVRGVYRTAGIDNMLIYYSTDQTNWFSTGKTVSLASGTTTVGSVSDVKIPATAYIRLVESNGSNQYHYADYVEMTRTGDYSGSVTTTLGTNGYGTFACAYPLDLRKANMQSGVTAYKASVSETTVTFTELNQVVPANTGILLQGSDSEEVALVLATEGTTVDGNEFLVNGNGKVFSSDDDYYYFGLKANTLTFGLFEPSTVAIPANKAYLKVLKTDVDGAGARALKVVFGDEATGINTVETANQMNGQTYNLSGQRVAAPQKGLYIVNGKKVIIK